MSQLSDITSIKSVLSRHSFHFTKSLGQNFLVNPDICPQMAAECGAGQGIGVLEVGPGIGVLTAELATRAEKVVSVELDQHLLPVLEETLSEFSNVKIVSGDILKIDINQLIADEFRGMKVIVCANLPYYITSPVIMRFLEERLPVSSITVMVQKEAANRLCARPGSRACGAVSAAVSYFSEPQILFGVDRSSFLPQPNVDSAVIRLDVREEPAIQIKSEKNFFALVKAAFGQRRKTVLNSVAAGLSLDKEQVLAALNRAEIAPNSRAEQLTMEQLAAFSNELFSEI
jgi:16S rRNA (adenine1518-N6/adenine1519-N6)-dimethyltransferase